MAEQHEFTKLLRELNEGNKSAEKELFPLVYNELRNLAKAYMKAESPGHTLQTTDLVHEAYLRLSNIKKDSLENRVHYMRIAARAMRRILIDHARHKRSVKERVEKHQEIQGNPDGLWETPSIDLIALDNALNELGEIDEQLVRIVELRFFGGLTVEETARALEISPRTVKYCWRTARAWLKQRMEK